jgi:hypothetical protein
MSDIYPVGLPSSGDPFSDAPELSDETISEYSALTDDDFADDDDAIDITESDGPNLEDGDDLS